MTNSKIPNKEQLRAIEYLQGPSLIIAGAGTGKTYVLTEKIKKTILEHGAQPQEILALTFTEKAAMEMEERVDKILPYGYYQTWIMTFHSFADTLLREYGTHIGINPSFKILTQTDAIIFFQSQLHKFTLKYFYSAGNPTGFVKDALQHFYRLRDENIDSKEYLDYAKEKNKNAKDDEDKQEAEKLLELAHVYQTYETLKLQNNYLDFSDLIFYLVKLLKTRKNILKILQKQFKYCLIDEFQDTNIVQYDLIKLLFSANQNPQLTVIGDDNQSIYKFRGASVSNILNFMKDYSSAKIFVLRENYRSYQEILDAAYRLVVHNNPDTLESKLNISKKLIATRGKSGKQPTLLYGVDGEAEAELIAKKINQLVKKDKYKYADCAILLRANDFGKSIVQALTGQHVPFQFLGPALLYYKNEVRDLIALLRFLYNPNDSVNLYRVLSMRLFNLSEKDLLYLSAFSKRVSRSLFEVLDVVVQLERGVTEPEILRLKRSMPFLTAESKKRLMAVYEILEGLLRKVSKLSAAQLLYEFLERSGYLKILSKVESEEEEQRLENITRFFNRLKKIEGEFGEASVEEAVDNINLALELGESPFAEDYDAELENAVNILTVHSAKGLEFPIVFLPGLVLDRFPVRGRRERLPIPDELIREVLPSGDFHIQEERRLFYVGLTRARDRVFLSFADYYGAGKRKRKPSLFISEALGEKELKKLEASKEHEKNQLSIFDLREVKTESPSRTKRQIEDYGLDKYSFSQIEVFEKCPLQYKFRYLLRIPEPDSAALSFGSSVHKALELFYKDVQKEEKLTVERLIEYFKQSFIPYGFISSSAREKAKKHGERILARYFETFHQEHGSIIALEQNFVLKLKENNKIYIITGKIDRIDKKDGFYEIIDYKTGKMPAETELKKSLQLGIYALSAMDKNLFALPQEKIKLTFYYLDKNEKFTFLAKDRDLDKIKKQVVNTLDKLQQSSFEPVVGRHCDWCSFKIICPAWGN